MNYARPTQNSHPMRTLSSTLALLATLVLSSRSEAQSYTEWTGSGNNWNTSSNWNPNSTPNNRYGQLEWKGNGNATSNNDLSGLNMWRLYFSDQNGAKSYSLTGNSVNLFDFGGANSWILSDSTANQTFSSLDVNFAATAGATFGQISARSTGNLTLNNIGITGSQVSQLRVVGQNTGRVIFNGTVSGSGKAVVIGINESGTAFGSTDVTFRAANTYSGETFVNAGTLRFDSGGTSNNSTIRLGDTSGSNSATIALTNASGGQTIGSILNPRAGTSGTLTLLSQNTSGNNTWSGNVFLDNNLTVNQSTGGTLAISNANLDLKAQTLTFLGGGSVNITGVVQNTTGNGSIVIGANGTPGGPTVTLSGTNTYTGDTRIVAGTLAVAAGGSLGNNSNVFISANGSLSLSTNVTVSALREAGTGDGGSVSIGTGATLTVNGADKGTMFQNSISGGGNLLVAASGNSSLSLYGNQTYTGTTTVSGGKISTGTALATSAVTVSGGTFETSAANILGDSIRVTVNSGTYSLGGNDTIGSLAGSGGTVALQANRLVAGGDNTSASFDGTLTGSGGHFQKTGSGTTTLTGNNTYSGGTTVSAGTLLVNNTAGSGTGNGTVSVSAGATLGGIGTISGNTTLNGNLNAGNGGSSAGLLTFGNALNLSSAQAITFDIGGTTRGTNYDAINVSGLLTNGGTLSLTFGSAFLAASSNTTFDLFGGAFTQSGNFTSVTVSGGYSATLTRSLGTWSGLDGLGNSFSFSQSTGDLTVVAVPEPSTWLVMALTATGIFLFALRRGSTPAASVLNSSKPLDVSPGVVPSASRDRRS